MSQSPSPIQVLPSFDELVLLAEQNPEAFSSLKQSLCDELIDSASAIMQERLRAQQNHLDRILSRCKNPHHANVKLMQELSLQMIKFRGALEGDSKPSTSAQIIPFQARHDDWR